MNLLSFKQKTIMTKSKTEGIAITIMDGDEEVSTYQVKSIIEHNDQKIAFVSTDNVEFVITGKVGQYILVEQSLAA